MGQKSFNAKSSGFYSGAIVTMLAALFAVAAQDAEPEKVRVSGDLWTAYALTDGVLVNAQAGLNAGAALTGANSVDRFTGRARVRFVRFLLFMCSFDDNSFIHSFIHSFVHSFNSFIHSFIH